jgi:nicotinamide-nucleotide adenylyltransferase
MSPTRGFLVGRFQPFHEGHHNLTTEIAVEVDELIIGIGSAGSSHTVRNPFTAGERIMMITKTLEPLDIITYPVPIEDLNRNSVWVSHVQSMSPAFDVAYSNNPLVIQLFSEAGIPVEQTELYDRGELKGSEIRQKMIDGDAWEEYVPDQVVEVINEIGGIDRLRTISKVGSVEPE